MEGRLGKRQKAEDPGIAALALPGGRRSSAWRMPALKSGRNSMIMNAKTNNTNNKKRYVIYTRCSTDDQAQGDFTTLDSQAHHCKNMLDAFGYDLAKIGNKGRINDDGYSGKDLNRPGIQMIIDHVRKEAPFDGIIFFRLDRLTRNTRDLYWLIDLFREKEIDFVSVRENLDSSTAIGRVVIGILGILSAFERELTGERVKASAIARVRQGKWVGGMLPYGYKLIPDGEPLPNGRQPHKIILDEKITTHLKVIWEMAADNRSLTQVGLELHRRGLKTLNGKEWRRQVISRILKNPFYKGYIQYSGEYHKGNHPPIVDEKLWERANKILSARLPGHNFVQKERFYEYLLAGILRCGDCGSHMVCNFSGGRDRRKFFYYECSRSRQALGCKASRISATTFDKAIIDYFKRAAKDRSIIIKALGDAMLESQAKLEKIDADLKEKESKLNGFRHQANKLLELAMGNTITKGSTYKDKMNELETEIAKLEDEIDKLQAQKRVASINACSGELVYRSMNFAIQHLEDAPPEAQKSIIQALIKDIYVYSDRLVINMYIEEPLEGILPDEIAAINEKRPTEACKALVATASLPGVSDSCQQWLPPVDSNHN